jgi:hypothetical protein
MRIAPLQFTVVLGLIACSPEQPQTGDTGGSSSVGGSNPGQGGAPNTGGRSTGGSATGGVATGGTPSGGTSTGGIATGGKATGGTATGGNATGGTTSITGPCDIYQSGSTPCVAAHSTVRALFGAYSGNLYQVRRASDKTTRDIAVLSPGGYANSATQDSFCSGTTCAISIIYDQSPKGNHLKVTPPGGWLANGGTEANATAARITANGHTVYGVYTTGSFDEAVGGVGYRNNTTQGVATGDQPEAMYNTATGTARNDEPESMYMVTNGKYYNDQCCFDYGNAETNNLDNGNGTMEAVYFGNSTQWGKGSGSGPWVMADLENGIFAGQSFDPPATNTSLVANYVTAMLKGRAGSFALKGGDAQSGTLKTMYDGPRPSGGYNPMRKEGAIILGVGGDNSHTGEGTFFEGCMTYGSPPDATDDAVQANIVAAGYGR